MGRERVTGVCTMKLMHLSDLHIGKRVNEFSMLEDQRAVFEEICHILDEEKVQGVIIAGDVYDRQEPSAQAVQLCDDLICALRERGLKVFVISGNHDSAARISYGRRVMRDSGIYLSRPYDGGIEEVCLEDEYGPVQVYLMPFLKPAQVRAVFPDNDCADYTQAVATVLDHLELDGTKRNVLVMHQFVAGAQTCESEEAVGSLEAVDAALLEKFDYVALGHIHRAQQVHKEYIRYAGTPLKYSLSEVNHHKSVTIVDLGEKGSVDIRQIPLHPLRDMYEIRGSFEEVASRSYYEGKAFKEGYLHIILTDEEIIPEAMGRLRAVYPYIMKLSYDNTRTRTDSLVEAARKLESKSELELFEELYVSQNGQEMTDEAREYMRELIEQCLDTENIQTGGSRRARGGAGR